MDKSNSLSKIQFLTFMRRIITDNQMLEIVVETGEETKFVIKESRIVFEKDFFYDNEIKDLQESFLFMNLSSLKKIDMCKFDFSKIQDMSKWFYGSRNLEEVVFPIEMNCQKLTDLSRCFSLTGIKSLDLSRWKFGKQTIDIEHLTSLTHNIKNLTLPKANLATLHCVTYNCFNLEKIDFNESYLVNIAEQNHYGVFEGCSNLKKIDCSKMKNNNKDLKRFFSKEKGNCFNSTNEDLIIILPNLQKNV